MKSSAEKKGHGEKRGRREELALIALITEPTTAEAAKKAGIGHATLWRWLQDPDFQEKYRAIRRQAVSQAVSRLQQASTKAVDTLMSVMKDKESPAASKVSAAKIVLEMSVRAIEMEDLEARIAALEKASGAH